MDFPAFRILILPFFLAMFLLILPNCKKDEITLVYGTITDVDGNKYKTIKIGTQIWMAEDLKCSRFNDWTPIDLIEENITWRTTITAAYCWYNNDIINKNTYGAFYNWFVVNPLNSKNICPSGWHVPTDSEWTKLVQFLDSTTEPNSGIQSESAGNFLKTSGTLENGNGLWTTPNENANNSSGFSAIPGGERIWSGSFGGQNHIGAWWSSTQSTGNIGQAYNRSLVTENGIVFRESQPKKWGHNLRCIKNK